MAPANLTANLELDTIGLAVELADLERLARPWAPWLDELRAAGVPMNADDDDEDDADDTGDDDEDDDAGKTDDDGGKGDDDEDDGDDSELGRARKALARLRREKRDLERTQRDAAAQAKKDAGKWKELAEERERELEELRGEREREAKISTARAALLSAKVKPERVDRAIRLLDLDELEDDDDVTAAVRELKRDTPEWFARGSRQSPDAGKKKGTRKRDDDDDDRGDRRRPVAVGADRIRSYYDKKSAGDDD